MRFWIVTSKVFSNTWFLFRENGVEIQITVKLSGKSAHRYADASMNLSDNEIKYFNENYFFKKVQWARLKNGFKINS